MIHYPVLAYVSLFSRALPFFAGVYRWIVLSREMKILFLFLAITLATDIISMWFIKNYWFDLGLMHVYVLFEYIFVMSILCAWQESQRMSRFYKLMLLLYISFWFCAKFTFEPLNGLYSLTMTISQVILTLSAGYTLFVVIGNRLQPLLSHYRFWVLLSFVLYYIGTLIPIALQGILIHYPREDLLLAQSINWSLSILSNVAFTRGFLCTQTQQ